MTPADKNRWYSRPVNSDALSFGYGYSPAAVGTGGGNAVTGVWNPFQLDANGFLQTTIAGGVSISGGSAPNQVAITGNPVVTITGVLATTASVVVGQLAISGFDSKIAPLAVSGALSVAAAPIQAVSGFTIEIGTGNRSVFVANTAPINVTGIILTQVTGSITSTPAAATAITGNPGVTVTGFNSGIVVSVSAPLGIIGIDTGIRAVNVTNTAPIPVSGVVQAAVTIGSVAVTGGNINVTDQTSWGLLSGISGALSSNLSSAAYVTGLVSVVGTSQTNALLSGISGLLAGNLTDVALVNDVTGNLFLAAISGRLTNGPLYVTGTVLTVVTGSVSSTISNPIGVSGVAVDTSLPTINGFAPRFLPMGGKVVASSGAGSITGYNNTGDMAMLNISKDNGGLFVVQGCLDSTQDNVTAILSGTTLVTTIPSGATGVSNQAVSGVQSGVFGGQILFQSNPNRLGLFIQNLHTGALLLRFSTSMPTSGLMNVLLKGGTTISDGNGASWSDMPAIYKGPISCTGFGGSPTLYNAWEI